jgi:hypothetical protein
MTYHTVVKKTADLAHFICRHIGPYMLVTWDVEQTPEIDKTCGTY